MLLEYFKHDLTHCYIFNTLLDPNMFKQISICFNKYNKQIIKQISLNHDFCPFGNVAHCKNSYLNQTYIVFSIIYQQVAAKQHCTCASYMLNI